MLTPLAAAIIGLPVVVCLFLCAAWWWELPLGESAVARLANGAFFLSSLLAFLTLAAVGGNSLTAVVAPWYQLQGYEYVWRGALDPVGLTFAGLAALLLGVIGMFSRSYLHQEKGFLRFYLLTLLFGVGVLLVLLAASLDQVFFGWELVGLTSALLIAFFSHRSGPVRGGLRAFMTYRVADIGLLGSVVYLHHLTGTTSFSKHQKLWLTLSQVDQEKQACLLVLLLVLACMGKSALVPFGGWLPRAMEGPTPSSAVFYGALSVHLGPFLMLRCSPLIEQSIWASALLIGIGLLTAFHGTLVGRVQSDVKSALAYGSMTQVGLIFVEIGLGLYWLAILHMVGHACVRTLEILRAPSVLHDYHQIEVSLGEVLPRMGLHYERLLPRKLQVWLYRLALERGFSEALLQSLVEFWKLVIGKLDGLERLVESRMMGLKRPGTENVEALR